MSARRILHLDMDAFFASVELLRRPELTGMPVVIGGRGDPRRRGVVSTASYAARQFGIHSAMPLARAYRLCPQAVFLPVDFDAYAEPSRAFKAAMRAVSPLFEDRGIDEAFIDVTQSEAASATLARDLKACIFASTGLTCSIGIAANKLLAKISSDLDKPDGLTVIGPGDLEARIWPLGVRKIPGIGPKAEARLADISVRSIGELAAAPIEQLRAHFGATYAEFLRQSAHGMDERPLVTLRAPKSRSRETTFQEDIRDWQALAHTLASLAREVAADLHREGCRARTVGIKLRFADFRTHTRATTFDAPTDSEIHIRKAAFACLARIQIDRHVRLLGVRAHDLSPAREDQTNAHDAGSER